MLWAVGLLALASPAIGQDQPVASSSSGAAEVKLLTLGTPALRSTLDRMNVSETIQGKIPDIRLKVQPAALGPLSAAESEWRVQGVEFRLPVEGLWVGYERGLEEENRRATLSLKRGF